MKITNQSTKTETATLIQKFLASGGTIKKCPQRFSGSETDCAWHDGIYDPRLDFWTPVTAH